MSLAKGFLEVLRVRRFYRKIHRLMNDFHVKFHFKNRYRSHRFAIRAVFLHAQVQFHAKYPFFDSQSDREFTFSCAIL